MFGRPGVSTCTSSTACTGARTSSPAAPAGDAGAVLLRAAVPIAGLDVMRGRRPAARRDRDLCAGPARLASAFGIDRAQDGIDLVRGPIGIHDDGTPPPARPRRTVARRAPTRSRRPGTVALVRARRRRGERADRPVGSTDMTFRGFPPECLTFYEGSGARQLARLLDRPP